MVSDMKLCTKQVVSLNCPQVEKNVTHSAMVAKHLFRTNSGWLGSGYSVSALVTVMCMTSSSVWS